MRQPITLKIKFKSASLDQFIERYSVDVSRGGIFIRTKEPLQVGTQLKFEFQLQDASALISGEGTVVWIREHDPNRTGVAPGMGVRFDKVASTSNQVLDQILAEKTRRGEAAVESRFDAGVRASTAVSGTVPAKRPTDFEHVDSKTLTPLPKNVPGLEGAEDDNNEFNSNESTRVMQDDVVQRLAEKTRGQAKREEGFPDEPTRARSSEEIDHLIRSTGRPNPVGDGASLDRTSVDEKTLPPLPGRTAPPVPPSASVIASTPPPPVMAAPPPIASAPKADALPLPPAAAGQAAVEQHNGATAAAVAVGAGDRPLAGDRPAERKKSSPLPAILVMGGLAALVVGYVVLSGTASTTTAGSTPTTGSTPSVDTPAKTAPAEPTAPTPEPVAKADPGAVPTPPTEPAADPVAKAAPEAAPAGPVIAVSSEPPGATVLVDGKEQPTATPTSLSGLDPKKTYEVRVALKGHREWKGKLVPKEGAKVEAKLVANEKVVEVSSTPTGTDLFLDGTKVGRTPFTIRKLDATKDHKVELRRGGFVTQTRNIGSSDAWETKGEGRDVLALALTLEAEPKVAPKAVAAKRPPAAAKPPQGGPAAPAKPVAAPAAPAPSEAADKKEPAAEKPEKKEPEKKEPAVEKAEKPVEKPAAEKPAEPAAGEAN